MELDAKGLRLAPSGEWWNEQQFKDHYGGTDEWNAAEDKDYNKCVKPWRDAWLGKTCESVKTAHKFLPKAEIELLTVKGGPECEWERVKLDKIRDSFQDINIQITHCADLNELFENVAGNKKRSWSIM